MSTAELPFLEIEDNQLTTAHIGREVEVLQPGRPSWVGRIAGWSASEVEVTQNGLAIDLVLPTYLHWVT